MDKEKHGEMMEVITLVDTKEAERLRGKSMSCRQITLLKS
jgi:hypothetical protein